jgi:hypothetical protein
LVFSQPYLRKSASIRGCSVLFASIGVHSRFPFPSIRGVVCVHSGSKLSIAKRGVVYTLVMQSGNGGFPSLVGLTALPSCLTTQIKKFAKGQTVYGKFHVWSLHQSVALDC